MAATRGFYKPSKSPQQKEQFAGGHRQSKGAEVGTRLVCLKNSKEAEESQVVPDSTKPVGSCKDL